MFSSIRKAQILIPFFNQRLADYAQLARLDLITFRNEMIAAIVGAAIGVASLLLLLGFVCVAVIITEWDTPYRIRAAWIIVVALGAYHRCVRIRSAVLDEGFISFCEYWV
jgi:hypothetical protein